MMMSTYGIRCFSQACPDRQSCIGHPQRGGCRVHLDRARLARYANASRRRRRRKGRRGARRTLPGYLGGCLLSGLAVVGALVPLASPWFRDQLPPVAGPLGMMAMLVTGGVAFCICTAGTLKAVSITGRPTRSDTESGADHRGGTRMGYARRSA